MGRSRQIGRSQESEPRIRMEKTSVTAIADKIDTFGANRILNHSPIAAFPVGYSTQGRMRSSSRIPRKQEIRTAASDSSLEIR